MSAETLPVRPLEAESFAPFGDVIETRNAEHYPINNGTTERFHDLARLDTHDGNGRSIVSIFVGQPFTAPIGISMMERHPLGSQVFMPLTANPYLVVVAGETGEGGPASPAAFLATHDQGVNYAKGVWHHPLLSLNCMSRFLVIDREGEGQNLEERNYPGAGYIINSLPELPV